MHSAKEKYERAPIKITYDQRPPSRHKTPQRAVGLEFFRGSNKHSIDSLDFKMLDIESDESLHDKDELSFTTPLRKNSIDPAFLKKNKTSKRNDISSIQNNYRPAKHLSVVRPAKNAWEFDADVKSDRKNKMLTPKQPKTQFDEEDVKRYYKPTKAQELKIGVWNSNKRKSKDIPLIVNKREGFNSSYHSIIEMDKPPEKPKRSENAPNLQESTRKRRSTNNMNIRTKSNPHKNRYAQNLAFNSTLEPEFLKLFAQDDVIS